MEKRYEYRKRDRQRFTVPSPKILITKCTDVKNTDKSDEFTVIPHVQSQLCQKCKYYDGYKKSEQIVFCKFGEVENGN